MNTNYIYIFFGMAIQALITGVLISIGGTISAQNQFVVFIADISIVFALFVYLKVRNRIGS